MCPSGEPNEAMALEALTAGWFPPFQRENVSGFKVNAQVREP